MQGQTTGSSERVIMPLKPKETKRAQTKRAQKCAHFDQKKAKVSTIKILGIQKWNMAMDSEEI